MTQLHFIIICDGGSRGNGKENSVGYGSFLIHQPETNNGIHQQLNFGEGVTNNEAEYKSLISAFHHIQAAFTAAATDLKVLKITVRMDSALVLGQMKGEMKVRAQNLKELHATAKGFELAFGEVIYEHITGQEMKRILGH
jgi:probable phosphoglycerate mutase